MAGKASIFLTSVVLAAWRGHDVSAQAARTIPQTKVTALSGQTLSLPVDLRTHATVLILGFGRHSQDATTAWEKPTRTQLAKPGIIGFYDMAMLAEVPGILRPLVMHSLKGAVPDVLKPNFLPLTEGEDAWKRAAEFTGAQPDAAYVMLVDRVGQIRWSTHAAFSPAMFGELRHRAELLAQGTQ